MIRNEVKLIGRLTANPELKYTKETNKALLNKLTISVTPKKELTKAKQYRSLTLTTRNRKSIR